MGKVTVTIDELTPEATVINENDKAIILQSGIAKKVSLRAKLKTYFDTIYGGVLTLIGLGTTLQTADTDTPLDADTWNFYDAVDTVLKKITWANLKTAIGGMFSNGLTNTSGTVRLGGNLTQNTVISDNGEGQNLEFGQNLTRLGNVRVYASGTVSFDGATSANFQTGTSTLTLSTTNANIAAPTISIAPSDSLIEIIPETVLTSASTIDIARSNNTLATALTAITLTISSTSTFTRTIITLTGTSLVLTFPANSLCFDSDGTASGDNTCTLTGVSGDVYEVMTAKRGATYDVQAKNFTQ